MDVGSIIVALWEDAEKVVACLALIAGVLGYRATTDTFRQKNSLEVQRRLNEDPKIDACIRSLSKLNRDVLLGLCTWESLANSASTSDASEDVRRAMDWLNILEEISVGIRHGVYSEQILYDTMKTLVIRTWISTRPFVKVRQEEVASRFEWFTWLGIRWMTRRDAQDRQTRSRTRNLVEAYKALDRALSGK